MSWYGDSQRSMNMEWILSMLVDLAEECSSRDEYVGIVMEITKDALVRGIEKVGE